MGSAWSEFDFHIYGRQSVLASYGNSSTTLQEEDLLAAVVDHFHLDPQADSGRIFQYPVEILSGTDADIEVDFGDSGADDITVGFPRVELMELFRCASRRYRATGRKSVLAVYKLNRLARSGDFMFFLSQVVKKTNGGIRIWSTKEGLLNPGTPEGRLMLEIHCGMAGGGESKTKSDFVRDAHKLVARSQPTRSLGERTIGYRLEERAGKGDKKQLHHVVDTEPHALLSSHSQVDLVRRVYDLTIGGLRPQRIAAVLNSEGWKHPHKGTPFTVRVIQHILTNTIYVGRQTRLLYRTKYVGSKKKIKDSSAAVEAPYCEELRIVDDAVFNQVQEILASRSTPGGRSKGRPARVEYYFSDGNLRCAGCGGTLCYSRRERGEALYACTGRLNAGQPRCQSHAIAALDAAVESYLIGAFKQFPAYVERLKKDLEEETSAKERRRLEAELRKKRGMLREIEDSLFDPEFTVDAKVRLRERYNELSKEVSDISLQVDNFGETEDTKRKRAHIAKATALASFEKMTKTERRAVLHHYVANVWVWPDGYFHIERKGNPLDLTERPLYIGEDKYELLYAKDWPILDFERMREDLCRLVDKGWVDLGDFFPAVSRLVAKRALSSRFENVKGQTLIKLYYAALSNAVQLGRLKEDMAHVVSSLLVGRTFKEVCSDLGLARETLHRIVDGRYTQKRAVLSAAETLGFPFSPYLPNLAEFCQPDYLADMVYWWDANDGFSMGQRLRAERGKDDCDPSDLPPWYWDDDGNIDTPVINGPLGRPQCINAPVITNYEYDDFRALIGV